MAGRLKSLFGLFGLDLRRFAEAATGLPWYFRSLRAFRKQHRASNGEFAFGSLYPCLGDRFGPSGGVDGQYFQQDLLVARRIYARNPRRHADIGSRIDGFVAHVAVFREIDVFDVRPLPGGIKNINFRQLDFMGEPDPSLAGAYDSVSCLHALEHFGLGRYGDRLDYYGYRKGFDAIAALVAPGGTFYLSAPMGPQRIHFNAHRVFSLKHLREMCEPAFSIAAFCYVDDNGRLHEDADADAPGAERNFGCRNGLAIFELIKNTDKSIT